MSETWTVIGWDRNHKREWRQMVRAADAMGACSVANLQRPSWVSEVTLKARLTDPRTEPLLAWARSRGFLVEAQS